MEIRLNELEWQLKGSYPWVPLMNISAETGLKLLGVTDWMPATVPGGVHYDLYRAGHIEHPYVDMNSLKCEWVENRWWIYKTSFDRPARLGRKVELICKGLDYRAIVFLNHTRLGEHEGMYHPAVFDITEIVRENERLELVIVFEHAPDEMAQIGKTSLTHTQKSRFNYKWDFSTRMVNVGIWDDILLKVHEEYSIDEVSLRTDVRGGIGAIDLSVVAKRHFPGDAGAAAGSSAVCVMVTDPEGRVIREERRELTPLVADSVEFRFEIENPELWYPNGHGKQPLYSVRLRILQDEEVVDERALNAGIRKLAYVRNVNSPDDSLPYTFVINGKKTYIKGVNLTPLDLMYGNVTAEHYEWLVYLMKRANVNMVRVWGGGVIEKETFYDLCDRHGIMIWQEFIQSSSGYDNIPSKQPKFLALLRLSAEEALRTRRNHVSLAVWSGGNELMSGPDTPSTYEDENIAMLKALVERHDPSRLFLPTSASGPVEYISRQKGVSHDVHGDWKYRGNPDHYEMYGESDNLFHSEYGVDGASSAKSLRKFLTESHLTPRHIADSLVWRHHGEWWDTLARDEGMFGPLADLDEFAKCSQWIQAEGLRYVVEANRRRKFENSGSIIWQFNEPWPNVSCTCLVDYYGEGKMAYHWVRQAYAPLHVSLDYRKLDYRPGEIFRAPVFAHGNGGTWRVDVVAQVLDGEGKVLFDQSFEGGLQAEKAASLGELSFAITERYPAMFFVRLRVLRAGETETAAAENVYYFSTQESRLYEAALAWTGGEVSVDALDDWRRDDPSLLQGESWSRLYRVTNTGSEVALHVFPVETSNAYWMEAEGAFVTLFPGETKEVRIGCVRKRAGGFLTGDQPEPEQDIGLPEIAFEDFAQARKFCLQ